MSNVSVRAAGSHQRSSLSGRERLGCPGGAVPSDSGRPKVALPGPQAPARAALVVEVTEPDPRRAVIRVSGELDLAAADALTDALDRQLAGGCRFALLDLSDLEFCSCAGLDALLVSRRRFGDAGGALTLTGTAGCVKRLVQLTGLDDTLASPRARDAVNED